MVRGRSGRQSRAAQALLAVALLGGLSQSILVVPHSAARAERGRLGWGRHAWLFSSGSGTISTVAGDGTAGYTGDGGSATSAELYEAIGSAADPHGNILFTQNAGMGNSPAANAVRVLAEVSGTFYGSAMTAGDVYTIAGGTTQSDGSGTGVPAAQTVLNAPEDLAVDAGGNVFIADYGAVRVVAASTGSFYGQSMTVGDIYTIAGKVSGNPSCPGSGVSPTAAGLSEALSVSVDHFGNVVIGDFANHAAGGCSGFEARVIAVTSGTFYGHSMTAGDMYTVAGDGTNGYSGDGGPATSAEFGSSTSQMAVDLAGNLVIADPLNYLLRVVAGSTGTFYGQSMSAGNVYTIAGNTSTGASGGDEGPASSATLYPQDVTVDSDGNVLLWVCCGRIRVIAGSTGWFYGTKMIAGNIYTVVGDGTRGYSGDGGPATSAQIGTAAQIAADAQGDLFFPDDYGAVVREVEGRLNGVVPEGTDPGADGWGGGGGSEPVCGCSSGEPVNAATGDFYTSTQTDLSLPGAGVPLVFARTFDAEAAQAEVAAAASVPALGYGWSDSLGMSLAYSSGSGLATVTDTNGAQFGFQSYAQGATEPGWCPSDASAAVFCPVAPRMIASLSHNGDGSWTYVNRLRSSLTYQFNSSGQLTQIADHAGDSLGSSSYSPGTGQPACPSGDTCTAWTSSASGRQLVLAVNGSGQLVSVFDPVSGETASFSFSGSGCSTWGSGAADLCSATDPGSLTTTYTYDSGNPTADLQYDMLTESPPGSGEITNTYDSSGRVSEQDIAGGSGTQTMTFAYATLSGISGGSQTTVTTYPQGTGSGKPSDVTVDEFSNNVLVGQTVGAGSSDPRITSYIRDPATLLPLTTIDGDGNTSSSTFNTWSDSGGTSTSSAQLTTVQDASGNITQYAYTGDNLVWCKVDPADYANGKRCPSSEPSSPPSAGSSDPNLGMTISFYNSSDLLTATTDPLGNTTVYAYTTSGAGVPVGLRYCTVDPVDYQKNVSCPAYGASHMAGTATETFDSAGDVTASTDADGSTTSTSYGSGAPPGQPHSTTDADGTTTTYVYNAAGQVTSQTATFGSYTATTLFGYDSSGRKFCEVSPPDAANSVTCPASAPSSPPTGTPGYTDTIYDTDGRVISTTSPVGGTTQYAYDQAGNRYCTVTPADYANSVRCPSSEPTSAPTPTSDPYVGATIDTLDAAGRVVQETNPTGGITLTTYDDAGNVTETQVESNDQTHAPTVTTVTSYDADNRPTTVTADPGGATSSTTLDAYDPNGDMFCSVSGTAYAAGSSAYQCPAWQAGWISSPPNPGSLYSSSPSSSQANNVTTSFYDADGQLDQTTTADVHTTVSVFDGDGRTYCSADADNVAAYLSAHGSATYPYLCPTSPPTSPPSGATGYTTTIFDSAGHATSTTDPSGDTTSTTFDPAGQPLQITDPGGHVTTDCYYWQTGSCASGAPAGGGAGSMLYTTTRPDTTADPSGETTADTYLPGGQTHTVTTPGGTTTYGYDDAGNQTSVSYSNTASGYTTPANVTDTYNPDGTKASMTDGTGTTTYSYDQAGRLTTSAFTAGTGTNLANQSAGYGYFSTGQLQTITYPSYGTTSNPQATYTYNPNGQQASVADWLGNTTNFTFDQDANQTGTSFPNADATTTAYNAADASTSITLNNGSTTVAGMSYTRDSNEQVTAETDSHGLSASDTYGYDQTERVDSINSNSRGYNGTGLPTTLPSGATPTYDAADELTADSNNTYTNNTDGDRTATTPTSGTATDYAYGQKDQLTAVTQGSTTLGSYQYNGDGLRLGKTISGTTTTFSYNTTTATPQILTDGINDYLYGPAGQVVEQIAQSSNTPTYLTQDQIGSTRVLRSQTGATIGTYTYDAYGNPVSHTGTATTPIGYAGGYTDPETGLIYLIHRYYDPTTGQFLSVDPLLALTGQPYGYAASNPINGADPNGLGLCWATFAFGLTASSRQCWGSGYSQSGPATHGLHWQFNPGQAAEGGLNFLEGLVGASGHNTSCNPANAASYAIGNVSWYIVALLSGALEGASPADAGTAAEGGAGASISDILEPGGNLIGKVGSDASIRELSGGVAEAQAMFDQLSQGGTVVEQTPYLTRVELQNGGFVQLRTVMSQSPNTAATIDINVPGLNIRKLKFNP